MRHSLPALLALVMSLSTLAPAESAAQSVTDGAADETLFRCLKPKKRIQIAFKPELELTELINWASAFSCEAIVSSTALSNRKLRVNIIAPKKMSAAAAWSLFQISLRAMNLALVRKGGVHVLVEAPEAKGHALPMLDKKSKGGRGLGRALVSAEFLSGAELSGVLAALKSKSGDVKALPGTDMVLVTDFGDHISAMRDLLAEVDRGHAENEGIYVIEVAHADVAELSSTIEAVFGATKTPTAVATSKRPKSRSKSPEAAKAGNGPRAVIADARTRSIILVASPAVFTRTRSLIKRLDVAQGEQSSHIHMVDLEHADAETLAVTLNALVGTRPDPSSKKPTQPSIRKSGDIAIEGDVRVTHDGPTNSLLVLATMRDFLSLREIIRRLDSTRPQVYIEATIMEVSVTNDRDVGASFHFGGESGGGTWLTGLQHADLQSSNLESLVGAAGLLGGLFGAPLSGFEAFTGQTIPSYGLLFQALATSRRANLLSSPRIMTSDNTAATLKVAERRREPGATTTVATGGTTQAVESVDAALTLKVTPHVNATDEVKLEIELTLEEFLPSRTGSLGSDKSTREITNTVVVQDQESIIIGGLMVERRIDTESKVPLLGDLPILGYLFKSKGTEKEKRNLVVLLTPYVLDSRADHNYIVRKTLAERSEFMRAHMNLKQANPRAGIDYRKKVGLLEAINQKAQAIEREKALLESGVESAGPSTTFEGPF